MPFTATGLSALTTANGFTLWHYRTDDDRAAVLAPGYFASAAPRLLSGDIVIVQASDATALVPIRGGTLAGGGVTVDGSGALPSLLRSATLLAQVMIAASATARAIALDPPPLVLTEGQALTAGATITGPLAQVTFTLRDGAGLDAFAPQTVAVVGGRAGAVFAPVVTGSGYRIHAAETADPTLATLSSPFVVAPAPRLTTEEGGRLLLESGEALLA